MVRAWILFLGIKGNFSGFMQGVTGYSSSFKKIAGAAAWRMGCRTWAWGRDHLGSQVVLELGLSGDREVGGFRVYFG